MLDIGKVHEVNCCLCAILGIFFNSLLIWMIVYRSVPEIRPYSRILLQTCVIDIYTIIAYDCCSAALKQRHLKCWEASVEELRLKSCIFHRKVIWSTSDYGNAISVLLLVYDYPPSKLAIKIRLYGRISATDRYTIIQISRLLKNIPNMAQIKAFKVLGSECGGTAASRTRGFAVDHAPPPVCISPYFRTGTPV
ncbi:serpentine type 7TM GPCR chemoreceptor srd domain-containing protein [Ditylenchus destructor]|uniref:Serpentine type 7TM GPCR chemoreceptor srd domain-containing protein n=1 Tax=Ditylenchus destructor TaxID=166010 RepID=A0AAD4MUA1_9BILA|nr:serpentine type 7TM GPCR chemoreceptor srd domain-containing protein [Ditylenchus destructor]